MTAEPDSLKISTFASFGCGLGLLLSLGAAVAADTAAQTDATTKAPKVLATIKPLHSLASVVTDGISEPLLFIDGPQSPHSMRLVPSQIKKVANADMILWAGENVEVFMPELLKQFADDATVVEFNAIDNMQLYQSRNGDNHNDDENSGHGGEHDGHDHGEIDAHMWLDPGNAMRLVDHLAQRLSVLDEANREAYEANAGDFKDRLQQLVVDIQASTKNIQGNQYVVYHDAFQYFEKAFGLGPAITISPRPQVQAGAKRLKGIKQRIPVEGLQCVFSDPQFKSMSIITLADELKLKVVEADPIASAYEPGAKLYIEWLSALADSFTECLSSR